MNISFASKGWTAVDCSDGVSLCAVSVRVSARGEKARVTAATTALAQSPEAEANTLRDMLGRVDRSLPQLVTLRRDEYKLRVVAEPAVSQREMQNSLRWALSTDSDTPMDDTNLDWLRIPTEEQLPTRQRQMYAVMTARPLLAARMGVWRQAGMRPKVVDIRETALRNLAGALERPGEGLALLAADADGVGIVITHQGSLYLDRHIDQPVAELRAADAETRVRLHERIALQLMRSVDVIARSYPFMPVKRVVIAPSPEALGLSEYLTEQLPLPVELLDLRQVFDLTKVPTLAENPALQARCLVPLGAALRGARGAAS